MQDDYPVETGLPDDYGVADHVKAVALIRQIRIDLEKEFNRPVTFEEAYKRKSGCGT